MKKCIPVLLFVILPLFYSCSNPPGTTNPPTPAQSITAQKNNANWKGTLTDSAAVTSDSLIVHAKGNNDALRLKFISARTSTYTVLDSNDYYYYTTDNNGAIVNRFKIDNTASNSISVVSGVFPNFITGQFTLRFKIASSTTNIDTGAVTFSNGKFTLKVH
jgi:hypothetical protein